MSKPTIFTLFLTAIVVVVVAEVLVDGYLKSPSALQADLFANRNNISISNSSQQQARSVAQQPTVTVVPTPAPLPLSESALPIINFTLVQKAGFSQVTLQQAIFNGVLFDQIDLKDVVNIPVILQHLLKNNVERVASFYEFQAKSHLLADEIYRLLKQKSASQLSAVVNETNSFGEGSFYVNFLSSPLHAFLVVKKGNNVYALTYEKPSHPFIQKLIQLLP